MHKKDRQFIVTGIVFAVFMAESLIHYSMAESKSEGKSFLEAFKTLPNARELATMAAIVLSASIISGYLVEFAEKRMDAAALI